MQSRRLIIIILNIYFLLNLTCLVAQTIWQKDGFSIQKEGTGLEIELAEKKIISIKSFAFNFIKPIEIKLKSSSSDSVILTLVLDTDDGYHNRFPKEIPLSISYKNNSFHFYASHKFFHHITITLNDLNEHYYGLIEKLYPHNSKNPDLRGNVVDVEVYGNGNNDYTENYASVYSAFFMSSNGYGSFFDTFAKGRYHFAIDGETEIYHQTDKLDWYIFYGPEGKKIHQQYYDVIGKPKYVPIWACGPIFWRDENKGGKDEILDDIQKFTDLRIPLTACWVDRPYSDGAHEWSKMNFNEKFTEPEKWIKTINDKYGLEFMTWIGPMTFGDQDFPGLLPNYKTYIDLTNPEAIKEFERRLLDRQYKYGVKGHKMDRADENFPMTAIWDSPVGEAESRNKYVYLYAKRIHEFLTNAFGTDQFNFARAAFHRTQPFLSAVWGGDSRSNWLGMGGSQANAMRSGFMAFPMWGNDTGGYLGEGRIDEKLYIRWLQWSAFNGMFEVKIDGSGGRGEDRPPWKYSSQLQIIYKNLSDLRMKFLPYIYSMVNTSYTNGVLMKPMVYNYPADENTYQIWDQYIFCNDFLVAPLFSGKDQREIYLPQGTWYNFYNLNESFTGPVKIIRESPIDHIPVFVKSNSIYVTGNIYMGNSKLWQNEISAKEQFTIHLFPDQSVSQTNFDYIDYLENDKLIKMNLEVTNERIKFRSAALSTNAIIIIRLEKKPGDIKLNGNSLSFEYNPGTKLATINVNSGQNIILEIK